MSVYLPSGFVVYVCDYVVPSSAFHGIDSGGTWCCAGMMGLRREYMTAVILQKADRR